LISIKGSPREGVSISKLSRELKEDSVSANLGMIDRLARVLIGVLLIAYAIPIGFPTTGWNWVGWIGFIPLATAVFWNLPSL
jgi:ABC-type uncharacterized transport system permease subunit